MTLPEILAVCASVSGASCLGTVCGFVALALFVRQPRKPEPADGPAPPAEDEEVGGPEEAPGWDAFMAASSALIEDGAQAVVLVSVGPESCRVMVSKRPGGTVLPHEAGAALEEALVQVTDWSAPGGLVGEA